MLFRQHGESMTWVKLQSWSEIFHISCVVRKFGISYRADPFLGFPSAFHSENPPCFSFILRHGWLVRWCVFLFFFRGLKLLSFATRTLQKENLSIFRPWWTCNLEVPIEIHRGSHEIQRRQFRRSGWIGIPPLMDDEQPWEQNRVSFETACRNKTKACLTDISWVLTVVKETMKFDEMSGDMTLNDTECHF